MTKQAAIYARVSSDEQSAKGYSIPTQIDACNKFVVSKGFEIAGIFKKFIHSDKVAAIIGPTSTGEGMNVKNIVEEGGVPTFMTVGGDPPIMKETGPFTYIFSRPSAPPPR